MLLLFLLLLAFIAMMIGVFASCTVTRHKDRLTKDSTAVSKVDSGKVAKTNSVSNTDWEWWRTTMQYGQPSQAGDTITNNNYYTNNVPQPKVVIVEGGKGNNTTVINQTDSSWKKGYDSIQQQLTQLNKGSKIKILSTGQTLGLCAGVCIVILILSKVVSNYSIIKKVR
jgi:hypothetical protein